MSDLYHQLAHTVRMNPQLEAPSFALESTENMISSPSPGYDDETMSFMEPSSDYLAPGLTVAGTFSASEDLSLLSFLPSKDFADKLLERYWVAVHPIARAVHRPSFEKQYQQFWREIATGFEPSSPIQALVFAMQFSASVSMLEEDAQTIFRCAKADMVRTFRMGCEFALSKSNLIRTTKTSTLQAFIMYLVIEPNVPVLPR